MSSTKVKDRQSKTLDFYETPGRVVEGLIDTKFFCQNGRVLEPSAGKGAIVKKVREYYPHCEFTTIDIQDFSADLPGLIVKDFLTIEPVPIYNRIVTNPPFSSAEDFVWHARKFLDENGKLAMLLRLPFIASVKRYPMLNNYRPASVHVLSQRPKFGGDNIDSCDYAWIIWNKYNAQETYLHWIRPSN